MVHRADIRALNEEIQGSPNKRGLIEALDKLEEIHDLYSDGNKNPSDHPEYAKAQEDIKRAVENLWHQADDMVGRTDVLENPDGTKKDALPNAALSRAANTTQNPPQQQ